ELGHIVRRGRIETGGREVRRGVAELQDRGRRARGRAIRAGAIRGGAAGTAVRAPRAARHAAAVGVGLAPGLHAVVARLGLAEARHAAAVLAVGGAHAAEAVGALRARPAAAVLARLVAVRDVVGARRGCARRSAADAARAVGARAAGFARHAGR